MELLKGKRVLIAGVSGKVSIAFGIAKAMHSWGAEVAFTYQIDKFKSRIEEMAQGLGITNPIVIPCDVSTDANIEAAKEALATHWDSFDILVHSIAFAPKDELEGDFVNETTRAGFLLAHDISSYSFTAMARIFRPMLRENASLLTLTYLGAERVVPNYNVMGVAKASLEANVRYMASAMGKDGIRVNAISAGPIKTLAALGIKDFRKMLSHSASQTPIGRNVTQEEVGYAAAFLGSDFASGITGEILYVDGGFHAIAMGALDS